MMISLITAFLFVGILTAFFYKTVKMDMSAAIASAVVSAGTLALLIVGVIYAGQLFG